MKGFYYLVLTLVIIGALNWFLIGIFDYNLVGAIFGASTFWSRAIYTIVGIAGICAFAFYNNVTEKTRQ